MNITEANDTYVLLDAALDAGAITPGRLDVAVRLADRAHRALHAGLTGEQVKERCGLAQQSLSSPAEGVRRD